MCKLTLLMLMIAIIVSTIYLFIYLFISFKKHVSLYLFTFFAIVKKHKIIFVQLQSVHVSSVN